MKLPRERLLWCLFSLAVALTPFLVIDIPPCTDLPQHVAQARLFFEALSNAEMPYRIQWLTPYGLSYVPLIPLWLALPPLLAAKAHMLLIVLACTLAIHGLAARFGRAPEAATLASLFVFSHPLYWGFLSFLVGFPMFAVWLVVIARPPEPRRRDLAAIFLAALALYFSHALWLLVGLGWAGVRMLALRTVRREWPRLAVAAPLVALLMTQSGRFRADRFPLAPVWQDWPIARFALSADAALGGVREVLEHGIVLLALAWIGAGILTRRGERTARDLGGAGLLLVAGYAFLPDTYMNTIAFARRWLPFAIVLLMLATPVPRLSAGLRKLLVAVVALASGAVTTSTWRRYEQVELAGFREALDELPDAPRVLGLVLLRGSDLFRTPVTLQLPSYAQVVRGGVISFSFAEHPASLVVYDEGRLPPWTPGLDWYPERLSPTDFRFFDHVLASGDARLHGLLENLPHLDAATPVARWRLYRVVRP